MRSVLIAPTVLLVTTRLAITRCNVPLRLTLPEYAFDGDSVLFVLTLPLFPFLCHFPRVC